MEQRIVNLQIKNEYIIGSGVSVGAVGSHDDVLMEMDFRGSFYWAGTTRRAIFSNALGESRTPIILGTDLLEEGQSEVYLVPVPQEAKGVAGECFLTVEGFVTDADGKEIIRCVTEEARFRVLPSKMYTNDSDPVTPSQAEQLQAEIDKIKENLIAAKGDKGEKGDPGEQGPQGVQGPEGPQGPQGKIGKTIVPFIDENGVMSFSIQDTFVAPSSVSVRGPQGPQGVQGEQGAQGARGPQGIQGVQGVQGPKGEKGDTGETGPAGPQGIQGIQGIQGKQGETGPAGAVGPVGATGPQGPKGDTGAQGPQGIQGETGPQGPIGAQGPAGPQGERGPAGADGRSFVIQDIYPTLASLKEAFPTGNDYAYQVTAEDKEIFIWSELVSDWVSAGALQGPQGPQGIQGIQGPKGDTGEQGPQGIQGPAGPQGPTGETGPQGPKGDTGATGPEGPQGIQGPQGEQGIQGEKGDKGDKGDTGAQGPQGEQGVQGPEGPQGPAGVAGADGKSAYQTAVEAGYAGTETAFNEALNAVPGHISSKENPHGVTAEQAGTYSKQEINTLLQGFSAKNTVFNSGGSITETGADGSTKVTTFGDGVITEVYQAGALTATKTTTFNADGSITESIS